MVRRMKVKGKKLKKVNGNKVIILCEEGRMDMVYYEKKIKFEENDWEVMKGWDEMKIKMKGKGKNYMI